MENIIQLIYDNKLESLKDLSADQFKAQDNNKNSTLMIACLFGFKDIVQLCIDKGVKVNIRNNDKETPLMAASMKGYEDIAQILIDNGAKIDTQSTSKNYAFSLAVRNDCIGVVKLLLSYNCEINKRDYDYLTPFERCAFQNKPEIYTIILEHYSTLEQVNTLKKQVHYLWKDDNDNIFEQMDEQLEDKIKSLTVNSQFSFKR